MTCWVYPRNANPVFPNLDGFTGIRNNSNADFYLCQYTPFSKVESRFTNSTGTMYTMDDLVLQLNTWQHLALTYDGAWLKFYYNGVINDSIAASGTFSTSPVDFLVGDQIYTTTHYYLDGMVDEASLWNKTLSASDIMQIYGCGIDPGSTDLKLYYDFNQGVPNGNNAGLTSVTDKSGHINATLTNLALNGTNSNYVTGVAGGFHIATTQNICNGDSVIFNGQVITSSGVFYDSLTTVGGCDSIIKLTVNVTTIDTSVVKNGNVLHANQNGGSYTWINCATGLPMPGATLQNFLPQASGNYACVIGLNGCSDTSSCWTVSFAGINENSLQSSLSVYPNPVDKKVVINFGKQLRQATISINDVNGKVVFEQMISDAKQFTVNSENWTSGVYVLKVTTGNDTAVYRIMKK
jgi:hypothetical protein